MYQGKFNKTKIVLLPPDTLPPVVIPPKNNNTTTTVDSFPLKKGSKGILVEQVLKFYNNAPSQIVKNKTILKVNGVWDTAMETAFKKSGLPLVITKQIFDAAFQLK